MALGSLDEIKEAIESGADLEDRDSWERTGWLLAIQTGIVDNVRLLQEHGADTKVHGRCGKPALFYAIDGHHLPMLRWLLQNGAAIEGADEFGTTPLMEAAGCGDPEMVTDLLHAGARVDAAKEHDQTALSFTQTALVARVLLQAGADPSKLPFEGRRALLGFTPEPDTHLLNVSTDEFQAGKSRRFGTANPEKLIVPFW